MQHADWGFQVPEVTDLVDGVASTVGSGMGGTMSFKNRNEEKPAILLLLVKIIQIDRQGL